MTTQTAVTHRNHRRAVRFFWGLLIGATAISLIGNTAHAAHAIYLTHRHPDRCRRGASHRSSCRRARHRPRCPSRSLQPDLLLGGHRGRSHRRRRVRVSFLALRDLMLAIGYSAATAWIFPAIIDQLLRSAQTAGDKSARRTRTVATPANTRLRTTNQLAQPPILSAKAKVRRLGPSAREHTVQAEPVQTSASVQPRPGKTAQDSAQTEGAHVDADLASELIASGVTTQSVETVIAVLAASRDGASINAAAKASGINYRTAQRIVEAAAEHRQRQLVAAS